VVVAKSELYAGFLFPDLRSVDGQPLGGRLPARALAATEGLASGRTHSNLLGLAQDGVCRAARSKPSALVRYYRTCFTLPCEPPE